MSPHIPSLDLSDFTGTNETRKSEFVNNLGRAFEEIGFVSIKNHFLEDSDSRDLYQYASSFFSLSDETKSSYEKPELLGQRGYVGKGKEHAKGSSVGDLKEFFHIGQPNSGTELPANVEIEEVPQLLAVGNSVYNGLEKTGITMLRAISLYLNLPENYFDDKVQGADSILRLIHYFPLQESNKNGAVRAAEHGDINLITLLMGASADGLEILNKNQKWVKVTAIEGHLVVNVGDMLERLTNNKLRSTIHRVVNPPESKLNTSRFSMPFFMHPGKNVNLACLESCINKENPKNYDDILAGEFLRQRLEEIGLKN